MANTKEEFVSSLLGLKDKPIPNHLSALEKHYKDKLDKCNFFWEFKQLSVLIFGLELLGVGGVEEHRKTLVSLIAFGKDKSQSFQKAIDSLLHDLLKDPSLMHEDEYLSLMRTIDSALTDHMDIGLERSSDLFEKLFKLTRLQRN